MVVLVVTGVDVSVTAVGRRAGDGAGVAVSSDVDIINSAAIVVDIVEVVVGGVSMQQRHGSTDYSRRGSVAGVDAFRDFYC